MKKIYKSLFLIIFNISTATTLEIETKHTKIIYDQNLEHLAAELYEEADEIIEDFASRLNIEIYKKFKIFILDNKVENAFVVPVFPHNIYIYPNSPISFNKNYKSWITCVFSHELIHALIGSNSFYFLGLHPFSMLPPKWLHEGAAVYFENGRGKDVVFQNIPKSYKDLSLAPTAAVDYSLYFLGYSFLNYIADLVGSEALNNYIYWSSGITSLTATDYRTLNDWSSNHHKSNLIGEKVYRDSILEISSDSKFLYAQDKDGLLKLDPQDFKVKSRKNISQLYYYDYSNEALIVKFFNRSSFMVLPSLPAEKLETACYINNKFIDIDNIKIALNSSKGLFYVEKKDGKEMLFYKNVVILRDMIFYRLLEVNNEIYFIASIVDEEGIALYRLDTLEKICNCCCSASTYNNKIYFTQELKNKIRLCEYDTLDNSFYVLAEADTILSPVRIGDKLYFLQYDEGKTYIYRINYTKEYEKKIRLSPLIMKQAVKKRLSYKEYSGDLSNYGILAKSSIIGNEHAELFMLPFSNGIGFWISPFYSISALTNNLLDGFKSGIGLNVLHPFLNTSYNIYYQEDIEFDISISNTHFHKQSNTNFLRSISYSSAGNISPIFQIFKEDFSFSLSSTFNIFSIANNKKLKYTAVVALEVYDFNVSLYLVTFSDDKKRRPLTSLISTGKTNLLVSFPLKFNIDIYRSHDPINILIFQKYGWEAKGYCELIKRAFLITQQFYLDVTLISILPLRLSANWIHDINNWNTEFFTAIELSVDR